MTRSFRLGLLKAVSLLFGVGGLAFSLLWLWLGPFQLLPQNYQGWLCLIPNIYLLSVVAVVHSSFKFPKCKLLYSIISGISFSLLALLWQTTGIYIYQITFPSNLLFYSIGLVGIIFGIQGMACLRNQDSLGLKQLYGEEKKHPKFKVRGIYHYSRHPTYFGLLLLLWGTPNLSLERLVLNIIWSVWILDSCFEEEKKMYKKYPSEYGYYKKCVPFMSWRLG